MLRNAFENLATEETASSGFGRVIQLLTYIQRAVTYAKDNSDQLRVVIANQHTSAVKTGNNTSQSMQGASMNPGHWGNDSWNLVDDRWEFANGLNGAFYSGTRSRWTF